MSEEFGTYLNQVRKAKASVLDVTTDEWQNCCDYATKTGQCVRVSNKDSITVDGIAMPYSQIVEGLLAIEQAEEYTANRLSLIK